MVRSRKLGGRSLREGSGACAAGETIVNLKTGKALGVEIPAT